MSPPSPAFPIADARREEATGVLTGDRTTSRRAGPDVRAAGDAVKGGSMPDRVRRARPGARDRDPTRRRARSTRTRARALLISCRCARSGRRGGEPARRCARTRARSVGCFRSERLGAEAAISIAMPARMSGLELAAAVALAGPDDDRAWGSQRMMRAPIPTSLSAKNMRVLEHLLGSGSFPCTGWRRRPLSTSGRPGMPARAVLDLRDQEPSRRSTRAPSAGHAAVVPSGS